MFREQEHVRTIKRRRDYLVEQLNKGGNQDGWTSWAIKEVDALDWALGILEGILSGDSQTVREAANGNVPS